jgi:intracellular septation protein
VRPQADDRNLCLAAYITYATETAFGRTARPACPRDAQGRGWLRRAARKSASRIDQAANLSDAKTKMPLLKLVLELGPLVIFFLANNRYEIFTATGAFMVATVISLIASRLILKKFPIMPLVTGAFVLVFGALTLYLQNDIFIKMKPTIVNILFAGALGGGLYFGRSLMKMLLGDVIHLQDEGWRKLTTRWVWFFLALAVLNEIVWRNFSTDNWVAFKTFGIMPLTFLFMMAQIGLLQKYQIAEDAPSS